MDLMMQVLTTILILLNGFALHQVNAYFECSGCKFGRTITWLDRVCIGSIWGMTVFLVVLLIGWVFPPMKIMDNMTTIFILEFNYMLYLSLVIIHLKSNNSKIKLCHTRTGEPSRQQPMVSDLLNFK